MKQWIKKKIEIKSKLFVKTSNKYFDILKSLNFFKINYEIDNCFYFVVSFSSISYNLFSNAHKPRK